MSIISNHSKLFTAKASHPCWLVRSHCDWGTGHAIPFRNVKTQLGLSRVAPFCFREGFPTAHVCSCSKPCTDRCAVPPDCSSWERIRFEVGHRLGFPTCGTANSNFTTSRVSSVSRIVNGVENGDGFGSGRKFHTVSRQDGRYICASAQEDFILENLEEQGVEIEHENEVDVGVSLLGTNARDVEKRTCEPEIWVVNFYFFVSIEDPHLEVARSLSFLEGASHRWWNRAIVYSSLHPYCVNSWNFLNGRGVELRVMTDETKSQGKDVRGRIYISHQGINAQLSGPRKEAIEYAEWIKDDSRFSDMLVQISPSPGGHAFPRLRLRYKPSLVQLEGGTLHLPITDPSARAVHLSPREWTERLDAATGLSNNTEAVSQELESPQDVLHDETSKARKPVVLLDVRNGYEWDVGHFKGAQRPNVDCFKSTEFGLTENETVNSDPLANVDKDNVDVMMYCTGGIRCDVFSTMLRQRGFKNLYTLKGGVSNFLKEEGARKWAGNLFVFDSRLAVSPNDYHVEETAEEVPFESNTAEETDCANSLASQAFARCRLCGDPIAEPRHRNCANLDCNLLYMSCKDCLSQHRGCCSITCSGATRLRPLLAQHQYDRWHKYRPQEPNLPKPADYVSRRALKRRRRKERRKLLVSDSSNEHLGLSSAVSVDAPRQSPM